MLRRRAVFVTFIVLSPDKELEVFAMSVTFLRPYQNGILLYVKVRPKTASRLQRIHTDATGKMMLVLSVSALPERGKANAAVCSLVADMLGIAVSAVSVTQGATSAQKTLKIIGIDPEYAAQTLASLVPKH